MSVLARTALPGPGTVSDTQQGQDKYFTEGRRRKGRMTDVLRSPHTSLCLSYLLGLERSPHAFPLPLYPAPCYSPLLAQK